MRQMRKNEYYCPQIFPVFGKLHPDAPCFPLSIASGDVSDSEAASKEQSAANVLTLLQREHLERLVQIQLSVAAIILSRQEGWSKEITGFPFGISISLKMVLNWYPKIVLRDITGHVHAVEAGADVAPCHHMQSHAREPPREVAVPASCLQPAQHCQAQLRRSQLWNRVSRSSALAGRTVLHVADVPLLPPCSTGNVMPLTSQE